MLYVVFLSAVLFTLSLYHFQRDIETAYIEEFRDTDSNVFVEHHCDLTVLKGQTVDTTLLFIPCIPNSLGTATNTAFQPNRFIRLQNESAGYAIERQQIEGDIKQFIDRWLNSSAAQTGSDENGGARSIASKIREKRESLVYPVSGKFKVDVAKENVLRLTSEQAAAKRSLDSFDKPGMLVAAWRRIVGLPANWLENRAAALAEYDRLSRALAGANTKLALAESDARTVAFNERNLVREWFRTTKDDGVAVRVLKGNFERALSKLTSVSARLQKTDSVIRNFKATQQKDGDFYNTLFSAFVPVEVIDNIWELPTIFMSMVLVLAMGGLGSLITVTIEFLGDQSGKSVRFSAYFFRPMLGTIVALAAYIGVKSGQVSVAGDGVSELSPFLLSFLGVLAGIMSERVYRRLVDYGEKLV